MWRALFVLAACAALIGALAAYWVWWLLGGSLPPTEGEIRAEGLTAPVEVERDALGIPTLHGDNRADVAFATGFVHAQDRFFQMDVLRRHSAGELAALFGPAAVEEDRRLRVHRFRARARARVQSASPDERSLLSAYAAGVRAGLASLRQPPWEYLVLQADPKPWTEEDTILVVLEMYRTLQETCILDEQSQALVHELLPPALADFLNPPGSPWDAPLLGPALPSAPVPSPAEIDLRKEPGRWAPSRLADGGGRPARGSNNWAVAGSRTAHGRAILANDMHLGLMVPNLWYRVRLVYPGKGTTASVCGATLPGTPAVVVGSSGRLAWGFTNVEGDFADLVVLTFDPQHPSRYLTPNGYRALEVHEETIEVNGGPPETLRVSETIWGPVFDSDHRGRSRALCWVAHQPDAVNLDLMKMETADSLEEALTLAPRMGTPGQNFTLADSRGGIAWTVLGRLPQRVGFDGLVPASWADGSRRWGGWLPSSAYPRVMNPPEGILWTANNRTVGEPWRSRIGKRHFDHGARARQIRDGLRAREGMRLDDMLAIQLDDRATYLARWQKLLLGVLSPGVVRDAPPLQAVRREVIAWGERASPESAGFRIVREFQRGVQATVLRSLTAPCARADPRFSFRWLDPNVEESVWQLVTARPEHLLPPGHASWDTLLLSEVNRLAGGVYARQAASEEPFHSYTWGEVSTARIRHPLSGALGPVGRWLRLDMPADRLPGAPNRMPRVQAPSEGASQRMAVSPGRESAGYFHMPTGQSGHPLSPHYRDGHEAWVKGKATPFLPGEAKRVLVLRPR